VGLHPDNDGRAKRVELETQYHTEAIFYNVHVNAAGRQDHREFRELIVGIADEVSAPLPLPPSAPPVLPAGVVPVSADDNDLQIIANERMRLRQNLGRGRVDG
jgi:hypothetical protein